MTIMWRDVVQQLAKLDLALPIGAPRGGEFHHSGSGCLIKRRAYLSPCVRRAFFSPLSFNDNSLSSLFICFILLMFTGLVFVSHPEWLLDEMGDTQINQSISKRISGRPHTECPPQRETRINRKILSYSTICWNTFVYELFSYVTLV